MFIQFHLIESASAIIMTVALRVILFCFYIFYPFIGLLTDVYIGRYRAIMIGIILCFISWIIIGISLILNNCYGFMGNMWIAPGAIINHIGVATFLANIIQYLFIFIYLFIYLTLYRCSKKRDRETEGKKEKGVA